MCTMHHGMGAVAWAVAPRSGAKAAHVDPRVVFFWVQFSLPPPLPQASNTVYVGNVESTVNEFTIKSIFENCGTVTNVRLAG